MNWIDVWMERFKIHNDYLIDQGFNEIREDSESTLKQLITSQQIGEMLYWLVFENSGSMTATANG